jgi:hypothetical protein
MSNVRRRRWLPSDSTAKLTVTMNARMANTRERSQRHITFGPASAWAEKPLDADPLGV